jgi:hypothetical protein
MSIESDDSFDVSLRHPVLIRPPSRMMAAPRTASLGAVCYSTRDCDVLVQAAKLIC